MKNLMFYGTTDYGFDISKSDEEKFKELSANFSTFVMTYGKEQKQIQHPFVNITYLKKPKYLITQYLYFYLLNYKNLNRYVEDNKINIISAKDPISAFLPIILKTFNKKEIKIVIEHHGDFLDLLLNQRNFYLKRIIKIISMIISNFTYKKCDLLRGVEETATKELANKYNQKYIYFPAWVDHTIFTNNKMTRNNFLIVGNVIPRKGILFLIKQFHIFSSTNNNIYDLKIVGNTPNKDYLKKCQDFINENKIQNIHFIGSVDSENISDLMNSSLLLLMASSYEGLPRVLIESSLCGLPSLSSSIRGISSPFGDQGGTLLYKYNNSSEFHQKLNEFINNKTLQEELSKKCQKLGAELAGENMFLNNWIRVEQILYE